MRHVRLLITLTLLSVVMLGPWGSPVQAQGDQLQTVAPALVVFTRYPSQVVEIGQQVDFDLKFDLSGNAPQAVQLRAEGVPEGWTAVFRGGGRIINAVYIDPEADSSPSVTLRVEPPENVEPGTYTFSVVATAGRLSSALELEVVVQDKTPSSLAFDVDLPTLRGTPTSTFRYSGTLRNEGDEDLTVNLFAEAPEGFLVTFKSVGQEITGLPLEANQSKSISIEVRPFPDVEAGTYPITVRAVGGDVEATIDLVAEITGQPELRITTPDGRLSGNAYAGQETPMKIVVQNNGTAPALGVELSASQPSGWSVEFDPPRIPELPAGQQLEVTVKIKPAEKAIAGDYMLTVRARPEQGSTESVDLRITVLTSTLWGVVGIVLIAVAVGVVGLAVMRFGRR